MPHDLARYGIDVIVILLHLFSIANSFNTSGKRIVVGLSIDIRLVELNAVGPLFCRTLYPVRQVACPVGCWGAAHNQPYVTATAWSVEGNGTIR